MNNKTANILSNNAKKLTPNANTKNIKTSSWPFYLFVGFVVLVNIIMLVYFLVIRKKSPPPDAVEDEE